MLAWEGWTRPSAPDHDGFDNHVQLADYRRVPHRARPDTTPDTHRPPRRLVTAALLVSSAALALVGCGGNGPSAESDALQLLASFYPLQFVAERVGGDRVDVTNLTPPGVEPHDLELAPQDVAVVTEADLVVVPVRLPAGRRRRRRAGGERAVVGCSRRRRPRPHRCDHGQDEGDGHPDEPWTRTSGWTRPGWPTSATPLADELRPSTLTARRPTPPTPAALARRPRGPRRRVRDRPGRPATPRDLVTSHDRLRLPRRALRPEQVGITGLSPDVEPTAATWPTSRPSSRDNDVTHDLLRDPGQPGRRRDGRPRDRGRRRPCSTRSRGWRPTPPTSDYLTVMATNLATLRDGLAAE